MNILDRLLSPTPAFFVKLRNAGLWLTALGGAAIGAHAVLPALAVKIAGYIAVAGGVMTTVSQAVVPNEPATDPSNNNAETSK